MIIFKANPASFIISLQEEAVHAYLF